MGTVQAKRRRLMAGRRSASAPEAAHCGGQSILEFAFLLPVLCLLLLGIIEVGRYAYISILVGNAARAGVAYGAQDRMSAANSAGIVTAARNDFQSNGQDPSTLAVTPAYSCACSNAGSMSTVTCSVGACPAGQQFIASLQVTASGTFTGLFNYPGIPSSMTMSRTATMRIAR